jgi:hypothetical protein
MTLSVSVEFTWRLDSGHAVTVDAEGSYDAQEGGVWPVLIAFTTKPDVDGNVQRILGGCHAEYDRIKEHAVICLCEKAREELKEAS